MKIIVLIFSSAMLLLLGCNRTVPVKDHKNMTTIEIIEVLENADIKCVSTTHSQYIGITLKDGSELSGKYNPNEAPVKYQNAHCRDILNLSEQIKKSRVSKWETTCE